MTKRLDFQIEEAARFRQALGEPLWQSFPNWTFRRGKTMKAKQYRAYCRIMEKRGLAYLTFKEWLKRQSYTSHPEDKEAK